MTHRGGEDDSDTQKRVPESSPDTVGANKKTSTPNTSDRSTKTKTTNLNLAQGKTVDALKTATSYLMWSGMHLRSRKMVPYNGFPNRLLELVRIFTVKLMMTRWRRRCIKFVGVDQIPKITYVHTTERETFSIHETLEKTVMSDKVKLILKGRTQMVERTYKYFNLDLSESHRVKLYICTPLDPRFKKFNMRPTRKYVQNSQLYTECL